MINYLVLSLDNDLGKKRRDRLNYEFEWVKGKLHNEAPDWVKEKMLFKAIHTERWKNILVGNWWAWFCLIDKIVEEKINNVIALEDDCFLVDPNIKIDISKLGSEPIWLNGAIHHPTNLAKGTKEWKNTIEMKDGINKLEDLNVRIISCWGLFIPKWEQAKHIRDTMKNCKFYRCFDAHLSQKKLIKYLFYPSLFYHKDFGESCCQKKGGKWENKRYF